MCVDSGRFRLGPVGGVSVHWHVLGSLQPVVRKATIRHPCVRRFGHRFFGKIRKVGATVNNTPPRRFPHLRRSPAFRWLALVFSAFWPLTGLLAVWGTGSGLSHAQPGTAGSIYSRPVAVAGDGSQPEGGAGTVVPLATAAGPGQGGVQGADQADQAGKAERVVAAALAGLARAPSITARVRQLVRVGNMVLKGSGRYIQSGTGEEQRYRYETTLNTTSEEFEMLEVCDGLFAWSYRKLGPQPAQVERVDIRQVRDRLTALQVADRTDISSHLGGIQRPLARVRQWFRFTTVTSALMDEVPIWLVEGAWDRESLALILPGQAEQIRSPAGIGPADLPEGVPWSVRLSISKRELFPCRIEWLAIPGPRPVGFAPPEVVAVLELYDVRIGEPVDATAFVYKPATEGLLDTTDTAVSQVAPWRP